MERLKKQMEFIIEIDKLKSIFRQSYLVDGTRHENDTEHSWHLAMMVIILCEHANAAINVLKVLKMVLIHDIVEIDAGDTYAYDEAGHEDKYDRESAAAKRLFGLLPEDMEKEYIELWEEFETRETAEAKFAATMDRVQPMMLNYLSDGRAWKEHGIYKKQVYDRNQHAKEGSEAIWDYITEIIEDASLKGYLK